MLFYIKITRFGSSTATVKNCLNWLQILSTIGRLCAFDQQILQIVQQLATVGEDGDKHVQLDQGQDHENNGKLKSQIEIHNNRKTDQAKQQLTLAASTATAEEANHHQKGTNGNKHPKGGLILGHLIHNVPVNLQFLRQFLQMLVEILVQICLFGEMKMNRNRPNPELTQREKPKRIAPNKKMRKLATNIRNLIIWLPIP